MPSLDQETRVPAVSAATLVAALETSGVRVVDLRSPAEFLVDHPPGARSVPLFDDDERALVGTLYSRRSPEAAFATARETVRGKLRRFLARLGDEVGWAVPEAGLDELFEDLTGGGIAATEGRLATETFQEVPRDSVVFTCWRGGLRSRSVVALLRRLGLERALLLAGGYKAYRRVVRERLASWRAPETYVVRGLTGAGKTLVLHEIESLRPGWTLDLEGLAGHRSSILGMVGLEPCSQKTFDTRLCARLGRGFPGPCVVEGESRKVGDVILPRSIWEALESGASLELAASTARRVQVLISEYLIRPENRAQIARQLPFIEERLGAARWNGKLVALLESGRERELVEILLERYYDPLYRHSEAAHPYAASFDAAEPARAAREIVDWIEARRAS